MGVKYTHLLEYSNLRTSGRHLCKFVILKYMKNWQICLHYDQNGKKFVKFYILNKCQDLLRGFEGFSMKFILGYSVKKCKKKKISCLRTFEVL